LLFSLNLALISLILCLNSAIYPSFFTLFDNLRSHILSLNSCVAFLFDSLDISSTAKVAHLSQLLLSTRLDPLCHKSFVWWSILLNFFKKDTFIHIWGWTKIEILVVHWTSCRASHWVVWFHVKSCRLNSIFHNEFYGRQCLISFTKSS